MPSKKSSPVVSTTLPVKSNNDRKYSATTGIFIVGAIFGLIISMFILNWLNKISKCPCANLPEKEWIREWIMFLIVWQIINLIGFIVNDGVRINSDLYSFLGILSFIIGIINIINIIRIFIYIRRLKEINCDCGLSVQENIIYYWIIVIFALWGLLILLALIALLLRALNN